MSLHTCIYGNEEFKDMQEKDKIKLSHILRGSQSATRNIKTTNSKLRKYLRLFYILDTINSHLPNNKKIVLKNIEHDKNCRKLIERYIDIMLKLSDIKTEMQNMKLDEEYNPLYYSSDNFEKYYDNNNLVNYLFNKYGSTKLHKEFDLYKGDIVRNNDIYAVKEILRNIESEDK